VESGKGKSTLQMLWPATLAGVACLGIASSAIAANTSVVPCDEVALDLRSLKVANSDLSVKINETSNLADSQSADSVDAGSATQDRAAPMLYLTPRVATILETVFDNEATPRDGEDIDNSAESAERPANELLDSQQKSAPVTVIDKDAVAPRFQRHMFRKDI
jgi:hypothetical protein